MTKELVNKSLLQAVIKKRPTEGSAMIGY